MNPWYMSLAKTPLIKSSLHHCHCQSQKCPKRTSDTRPGHGRAPHPRHFSSSSRRPPIPCIRYTLGLENVDDRRRCQANISIEVQTMPAHTDTPTGAWELEGSQAPCCQDARMPGCRASMPNQTKPCPYALPCHAMPYPARATILSSAAVGALTQISIFSHHCSLLCLRPRAPPFPFFVRPLPYCGHAFAQPTKFSEVLSFRR